MRLDRVVGHLRRQPAEASAVGSQLRIAAGAIVLFTVVTAVLQLVGTHQGVPVLTLIVASGTAAYLLLTHSSTATEAKYQAVFERAAVGIARVSVDGTWLEVNPAYCNILGYTRRELLSRTFRDVTHPDDLAPDVAQVERLLAGEGHWYMIEKRYVRKGGDLVWVELVVTLVRRPDGRPSYFVASVIDISARKAAELATREARALLDALYVQAPIGLAYFDRALRNVLVNETAAQMVGLSVDEYVGRRIEEIVPGAIGREVAEDMRRVIETGTSTTGLPAQLETRSQPPELRDLVVSWYPVRVTGDEVVGVGCIVEDVTQRLRIDRERERLVVELREAVRARDDFLSIASHELRTPLTTLTLGAEHLVHLVDSAAVPSRDQLRARAERLQSQGTRLERLVGTLLDVARIAQGRVELFPEELDVARVVQDQVERIRESASRSGSLITVDAPAPVVGPFDRTRLEQIVDNLVSNAVKFGAGKPISVTLETSHESIRLTVHDQGPGIAKEDRARIFERFERAVSERRYGGMGLGLWVTRQIVEAMGGTVFVTGELGQGSAFIVEWPRAT